MHSRHISTAALGALVLAGAGWTAPAFAQAGGCLADFPSATLDRAVGDLERSQPRQSAQDLRRAAVELADFSGKLRPDRPVLRSEAKALENAARDVESGRIRSGPELQRRLAEVEAGVARQQLDNSARAWATREYCAAGSALSAAARHAESGLEAIGSRVGDDLHKAAEVGRRVAGEGKQALGTEFEHARADVHKALDALRHGLDHDA
jgi:hypothetical protein